jgi:hypothetical protein
MARIDPEQERRRLFEFYAGQMDGELEQVAAQAYELTDLAREQLRAELARRGLRAELAQAAPVPSPEPLPVPGDPPPAAPPPVEVDVSDREPELRDLVTIRKFRDLPEALLAKGSLESAGIEAFLVDDNMVRLDWFWSNLMGGVKLCVNREDAEASSGILDQPIPDGFEVTGIGEYQQPHCPACQSLDVTFQELDQPVAYVSAYFHLPIPWKRRAWRCRSCNAEWEETEEPEADQGHPD